MGMPISVLVRDADARTDEVDARVREVFADLRDADETFSTYKENSEVSRLARGEAIAWSPDLQAVQALCDRARDLTGGAFDTRRPDGVWDPSGLVKSWAVERAAARLRGLDFCLNAGGDVHVEAPSGEPFRVGVQDPRDPRDVLEVLEVTYGGVATSGTAARGAHLYDPATGRPTARVLSVTVTGPSLQTADVLATAVFVRGPAVLAPGYEALVVDAAGGTERTPGWNDIVVISSPVQPSRTLDHWSRPPA